MIIVDQVSLSYKVTQKEGMVVTDMDHEKVMLSIENGKYYNLGEVGGEIWELIAKPIEVSQVIAALLEQYQVDYSECMEQVIAFLNHLLRENLIHVEEVR